MVREPRPDLVHQATATRSESPIGACQGGAHRQKSVAELRRISVSPRPCTQYHRTHVGWHSLDPRRLAVLRLAGGRPAGVGSILLILGLIREGVCAISSVPDLVGVLVPAPPHLKLKDHNSEQKRYHQSTTPPTALINKYHAPCCRCRDVHREGQYTCPSPANQASCPTCCTTISGSRCWRSRSRSGVGCRPCSSRP